MLTWELKTDCTHRVWEIKFTTPIPTNDMIAAMNYLESRITLRQQLVCQVMLTKSEWLQLYVLAGEDMSVAEYAANVLREHVQQNVHLTGGEDSAFKQLYQGKFDSASVRPPGGSE